MNILEKSKIPLEILVATTNRTNLDFIYNMFKNNVLEDYYILIINQTTKEEVLISELPNVRVINSFERGLSKSRNLAIREAIGEICLLADDDVVYQRHFEKPILESFKNMPEAGIISFKTITTDGKRYSNYPNQKINLQKFYKKVLSIEISFKRDAIIKNKLFFNENFGLGSVFQDGENRLFFEDVFKTNQIKAYFSPEFIVIHEPLSSSDDVASDRFIFARSALNYKLHGNFAWLYVIRLIVSLVRKKLISFSEISSKFRVANQGIKTYKSMLHGK
ncbi:glycosyltransferase family A protein [Formosa maritima]|uniref:Glycosyltransferase family 2 protein n=1 Tax=Formosa maritima TaxID=2592046 RepID=A0A5D0GLB9_9FLAO|nr:glycosyltransferase family A protein [Formosa maritima]TYA58292.1 glycosyltransferase family 2 protein [Formosa maritima]